MFDRDGVFADLRRIGLGRWPELLDERLDQRLAAGAHGDLPRWNAILDALPNDPAASDAAELRELLLQLAPWRKGPFDIHGVHIDAEWRSDLKWCRVAPYLEALPGRTVLDVGGGNGFYALQMLRAGAAFVLGVDPTLLYAVQFEAVRRLLAVANARVLPLRMEELPQDSRFFDTVFSMGVLYHRREPAVHLAELRGALRPGGQLVLETLILPGKAERVLVPEGRYARMRNVWHLPTASALCGWLETAGFERVTLRDVSRTTVAEQRSTAWMRFESLAQALDPVDASKTVEGLPAPTRAILTASAPGPL